MTRLLTASPFGRWALGAASLIALGLPACAQTGGNEPARVESVTEAEPAPLAALALDTQTHAQRLAAFDFRDSALNGHPALSGARVGFDEGLSIRADDFRLDLAVRAVGREGDESELADASVQVRARSAHIPRSGSDEWYEFHDAGIEHGITLDEMPVGDGPLVVAIGLRGLTANVSRTRAGLEDSAGHERLRYDSLYAYDATGRELPSFMRGGGDVIELVVDDTGAQYPVVVDPLVWDSSTLDVTELDACDDTGSASSLAVTADALVVGGPDACDDGEDRGAIVVFDKVGDRWVPRASIRRVEGLAGDRFGAAVAVTADALVAAAPGAERVERFERVGPRYLLDATLSLRSDAPRGTGDSLFGSAVAGDAVSVVVAAPGLAPGENENAGIVYVYRRDAGVWTPQQSLTAATPNADARFGSALALDANVLAVASSEGVHVFERRDEEGRFTLREEVDVTDVTGVALQGGLLFVSTPGNVRIYVPAGGGFTLDETLDSGGALIAAESSRVIVASAARAESFARTAGSFESEGEVVGMPANARAMALSTTQVIAIDALGGVRVLQRVATLGTACVDGGECQTGFCVDGVCCESLCGGDTNDCQACSVAAGATEDGRCEPAVVGTECRGSVGACDSAELCDGESVACPLDAFATMGTSCRPTAGACDIEDRCTGSSPFCPRDRVETVGTLCRPALGECDVEETCDGLRPVCPADRVIPAGVECRSAAGTCDVAEACDGEAPRCPRDAFEPFGFICRDATSDCDAVERCSGSEPMCPSDALAEDGTACRDGDACTMGDVCFSGSCVSGEVMCEDGPVIVDPEPMAPDPESGGCAVGGESGPVWALVLVAWVGILRRRRPRCEGRTR